MSFDPHMSKKPDPRSQVKTVDVEIKTQSSFFGKLRAYFFTGLVITAPIAITIWATFWFVTLFDARVKAFLPDIYNPDTYLPIKIPGFGLIFALIGITLIGFLAANLVGRTLIGLWDKILNRTPSSVRSTRDRSRFSRRCSRRRAHRSVMSAWWSGREKVRGRWPSCHARSMVAMLASNLAA